MKVLVVEDDEAIRELIARTLVGGGYEVVTAVDGVDALAVLAQLRPAAIVLDVNMPRMDGFSLLQTLGRQGDLAQVPVLMLTAQSSPGDIRRAVQAGATDYIGKPFEPRQLLRRLGRMLDPSRSAPHAASAT